MMYVYNTGQDFLDDLVKRINLKKSEILQIETSTRKITPTTKKIMLAEMRQELYVLILLEQELRKTKIGATMFYDIGK